MDIGKSFTYVTEDEQWLSKMIVGAIIASVPILNFAWFGYVVDLLRRVQRNEPRPLPDWSDLGSKFMQGLLLAIAVFVYSLPAVLVMCLPMTFIIAASVVENGSSAQNALGTMGGIVGLLAACCILIYVLAISFLSPAITLSFAETGTFRSCFEIRKIRDLVQANLSNYLTAWLVLLAASFILSLVVGVVGGVVGWIPCIGMVAMMLFSGLVTVYLGAVFGHLFGQLSSQGQSLDVPSPI
jgi:hypothetical protein